MRVVSNTSPIINLANVGQLDLLNQLYGDIIIPQAVFHEITVMGAGQAKSKLGLGFSLTQYRIRRWSILCALIWMRVKLKRLP